MVTRMLFVRHGQTRLNAQGRYQGRPDVPIDATGKRQAEAISRKLASTEIDAAYSSDLRRAWETGKIIVARQDIPLHGEPRLREIDFGEWEGLTHREIQERYLEALTAWEADPMAVPPPGGETFSEVATRVESLHREILSQEPLASSSPCHSCSEQGTRSRQRHTVPQDASPAKRAGILRMRPAPPGR